MASPVLLRCQGLCIMNLYCMLLLFGVSPVMLADNGMGTNPPNRVSCLSTSLGCSFGEWCCNETDRDGPGSSTCTCMSCQRICDMPIAEELCSERCQVADVTENLPSNTTWIPKLYVPPYNIKSRLIVGSIAGFCGIFLVLGVKLACDFLMKQYEPLPKAEDTEFVMDDVGEIAVETPPIANVSSSIAQEELRTARMAISNTPTYGTNHESSIATIHVTMEHTEPFGVTKA